MNYLYCSLLVFLFYLFSSVTSFLITKQWLDKSGLVALLADVLIGQNISMGLVCFSILILFYSQCFLNKGQLIFLALSTFAAASVEFYYGIKFTQTPDILISSKWELWSAFINQPEIIKIQQKFHCCGFFKPYEFAKDRCNVTFPRACYDSILDGTLKNITSTGIIYFLQSVILLIALGFIIVVGRKRSPPKLNQISSIESNTLQRNDHGAF